VAGSDKAIADEMVVYMASVVTGNWVTGWVSVTEGGMEAAGCGIRGPEASTETPGVGNHRHTTVGVAEGRDSLRAADPGPSTVKHWEAVGKPATEGGHDHAGHAPLEGTLVRSDLEEGLREGDSSRILTCSAIDRELVGEP
jgi:hypothetical protein